MPNSIIGEMFVHDHEYGAANIVSNHEMFVVNFLLENLKDDSNFVDIGAYQGYFSLIASKKIKTGTIYSFEPCIGSYDILKRNVDLHNLANVKIFNMIISEKTNSSKIYWRPGAECISRIFDIPTDNNAYFSDNILSTSLDEILDNHFKDKTIDCIKIDIEGAEVELFQGSKKFFNRNKRCKVILELHCMNIRHRNNVSIDKFLHYLEDIFDFYDFDMKKMSKQTIGELYLPSTSGKHLILVPK